MAPINLPDGSQVSEIVLPDGSTASEVLAPDGSAVFGNAIPDREDLHARYDATELSLSDGDNVSTWPDETGNGFDLTAGTAPQYSASAINGNPAVSYDGVDDSLDVGFTALSQPNHVFVVYSLNATGSVRTIYDSVNSQQGYGEDNNGDRHIFAGNVVSGGATDTNNHIFGGLYNGAKSTGRLDGSQILSADAGTQGMDGFRVGADRETGNFADVDVGEILIYPQDKTSIQSDVESYFSDKWGITI